MSIKKDTFNKLYEEALETAEKEKKSGYEHTEVVLVPIVLSWNKGKIQSISGVKTKTIIDSENCQE